MITDKRIYRTDDGRLVYEGHPDSAFLAYGIGDQVPDQFAEALDKEADVRVPEENKGSGLTIETHDSLLREAEDAGVKVDRRWGDQRLRDEIDAARADAAKKQSENDDEDAASEEE